MKTVPVSLQYYNGTILDSTTVTLTSGYNFRTTKPCSEGKWYYEVTHISGDSHMNFGFSYDYETQHGFFWCKQAYFRLLFYI